MEGHFLRILKSLAQRAELNCGHCKNVGEKKKQNCKRYAVCGECGTAESACWRGDFNLFKSWTQEES
jgi:hypothetical protein